MLTIPPTSPIPGGPLYIGDVQELTGLSQRSIRHYEDLGLALSASRTAGGFRVYDAEAVERLRLVMVLKLSGLSLEQIRPVVDACRAVEADADADDPVVLAEAAEHVERTLTDLLARIEPTRILRDRLHRAADASRTSPPTGDSDGSSHS